MSGAVSGPIAALLLIALLALWWLASVNALERARGMAREFCRRQGWQLLDHTVAIASLRPARDAGGWHWVRRYRFDFSPDGGRRLRGELFLARGRPRRFIAETDEGRLIEEG